jgi:hypothetical protein
VLSLMTALTGSTPLAAPDVTTVMRCDGELHRLIELRTRDDRQEGEVQLLAELTKGRLEARMTDGAGRELARIDGSATSDSSSGLRLAVETGKRRLVAAAQGEDEGVRGVWRVDVSVSGGHGTCTLRARGFELVERPN